MANLEKSVSRALAVAAALFAGWFGAAPASAQSAKDSIIGAWRLIELTVDDQGRVFHPYGERPQGLVIYDPSGFVMQGLFKPDLPKIVAANRLKGTDAEYREIMQGMLAGFGTYKIEGDMLAISWIASSYPNRVGTVERRSFTVEGDEMTSSNALAVSGGVSASKYTRLK